MKKLFAQSILFLSMIFITSCGKDEKKTDGKRSLNESPAIEEQASEGSYRAILRPYNNSLSGFLPTGAAEIQIEGDLVKIKTYLDDDARVSHLQNIHTGSRCPNISDDKNGDGLIDIVESYAVAGSVLISLDADINTEADGQGIYPTGGGFTYNEEASLSKMEADVKSRRSQSINLSGRVVLIHGVATSTNMPPTVTTIDGMSTQSSIPIVCGVIKRLSPQNN